MKKKETFQQRIKRESAHYKSRSHDYYVVKGAEFSQKLAAKCPELKAEFITLWLGLLEKARSND